METVVSSGHGSGGRGSRRWWMLLMLALVSATGGACRDDDITGPVAFHLTFSLDTSFRTPHGRDPIFWSLVLSSNGFSADFGSGVVSSTGDPAFSFTTADVMQRGVDYEVHYWIDSNIGGGTPGLCDDETIDHQWSTELLSVSNNVNLTVPHNPALVENVCSSFGP